MTSLRWLILGVFLLTGLFTLAAPAVVDPLSGTWTGDWGPSDWDRNQVTVELKWDGTILTGTVNPGPNAVELKKATFDLKTNAIHFEADATNRRGVAVHYVVDGTVEGNSMKGTWSHDNRKGDFKIAKK